MTAAAPRPTAATPARAWLKALETTAQATRDPARTLARAAGEWAAAYGDAPAVLSDVERFSFRALAERANAIRAGRSPPGSPRATSSR